MNLSMKTDEDSSSEMFFDNLVWMNSAEAARYLRLDSVAALRTAVCRGKLRRRKWNGKLYFKRSELDRLLEGSL